MLQQGRSPDRRSTSCNLKISHTRCVATMANLADEVAEMRCLLQGLNRKQLQTMAKEYNVKANMKSEDIIDALLRAADSAYGIKSS